MVVVLAAFCWKDECDWFGFGSMGNGWRNKIISGQFILAIYKIFEGNIKGILSMTHLKHVY